jgi:tRNA(Ile)-lysidine synthase
LGVAKLAGVSDLLVQLERTILERQLLDPGEAFLVAVSGGLDSMALLHLLYRLSSKYGWRLSVGHFNHRLRGRSSVADEKLVRSTAKRLGLKVKVGSKGVGAFAQRQGISVEMAARQLRHEFLARAAKDVGAEKVVLAHHADDQVELFFLRLFRGGSPEGLAGMKCVSPSPADHKIKLIRPLLAVSRGELEAYARQERVAFRTDATNVQQAYERNRVRHELLPLLRSKYQPALDATVLRFMELLGTESELVAETTRDWQRRGGRAFGQLHLALQRQWLVWECQRLGITADFQLIETLRLKPDHPVTVRPGNVVWRDAAGQLHPQRALRTRFQSKRLIVHLGEGSQAVFGGLRLTWKVKPWRGCMDELRRSSPGCERFDADKVGSTILLRHWRPGDRFCPIGMSAAVKVQDLLTNLKVPRLQRRGLVMAVTAAGEVFWIEGLRIAESFKIHLRTRRCLEWRWSRVA